MSDVLSSAETRTRAALSRPTERPGRGAPGAVPVSVVPAPQEDDASAGESGASELGGRRQRELALMAEVRHADPAVKRRAQARLVELVLPSVLGRARSIARTPADAEDAAQQAMIEIIESAKGFRGQGSLVRWCDRIAIRTTLRLLRRESRKLALVEGSIDPDMVASEGPDRRLSEAIPGEVQAYLAELSKDRFEVLMLRAQGFTIDEIASRTEASPNTVKDRLRMARKQVQRSIRQREVVAELGTKRDRGGGQS